jgi:uncharacterized protein YcbK (DUF882 family)
MRLTKNFTLEEFRCKDGKPVPIIYYFNVMRLAHNLQVIRDYLGVPIEVVSGYRTESHNKAVGGAPHSQHLTASAADIKAQGKTPAQVKAAIDQLIARGDLAQGGVGLYSTWVHYDIRGEGARWVD